MKKYLFIYITHIWNDDIKERFIDVTGSINKECDNVDILLLYGDTIINDLSKEVPYKCIIFDNSKICEHFHKTNKPYEVIDPFSPFKYVYKDNYAYFNNYDYIYFWEYDQWYSGNLGEYINELNKDNSDLIASYIEKLNPNIYWYHYKYYLDCIQQGYSKEMFHNVHIKSCLSFCRISVKYLDIMFSHKYNIICELFLYEFYVPTIIYNNGGTLKSISCENNEFDFRNDLNPSTFCCNVLWNNIDEMIEDSKKYNKPMLYTRWKTYNENNVQIR